MIVDKVGVRLFARAGGPLQGVCSRFQVGCENMMALLGWPRAGGLALPGRGAGRVGFSLRNSTLSRPNSPLLFSSAMARAYVDGSGFELAEQFPEIQIRCQLAPPLTSKRFPTTARFYVAFIEPGGASLS